MRGKTSTRFQICPFQKLQTVREKPRFGCLERSLAKVQTLIPFKTSNFRKVGTDPATAAAFAPDRMRKEMLRIH